MSSDSEDEKAFMTRDAPSSLLRRSARILPSEGECFTPLSATQKDVFKSGLSDQGGRQCR